MTGIEPRIAAAVDHHRSGRLEEAEAAYRGILETAPDHLRVLHNLGIVVAQSGRPGEAVTLFDRVLAADPDYASAYLNKGGALREMARHEDALSVYDAALDRDPHNGRAHFGAGEALGGLGRLDEAAARYERAVTLHPVLYEAHLAAALVLNALGRRDEALDHFRHTARIRRNAGYIGAGLSVPRAATKRKMTHDITQLRYLAARLEPRGRNRFAALADDHEAIMAAVYWPDGEDEIVSMPNPTFRPIAAKYNRQVHRADAPEIPGGALNPGLDTAGITRCYAQNAPGVAWFDGLLKPQALTTLRRFLLESTIWHDFTHIGGFLAAYLEDGLACPLLLQIAHDLRRSFPDIFGNHALNQSWAFKCLTGDKGIDAHADAAAVSVNFWVTPDDANLDPGAGGLVVYKARPPEDWRLKDYDADIGRIGRFLAENSGEREIVPYGENRAVIFNSDLFHESGAVAFTPGYENHRINITLLFGERDDG